jgi:sugar lactone lactonase YvrE
LFLCIFHHFPLFQFPIILPSVLRFLVLLICFLLFPRFPPLNEFVWENLAYGMIKVKLCFVDIQSSRMFIMQSNQVNTFTCYQFQQAIGTVVPGIDQGEWIVATGSLPIIFDTKTHSYRPFPSSCRASFDYPACRFNDGKCNFFGNLFVGSVDQKEENDQWKGKGKLFCYPGYKQEEIQQPKVILSDLTCPNGIVWVNGGRSALFIDTPNRGVDLYNTGVDGLQWKLETSQIISFERAGLPGYPDGSTLDSANCLWIAHWNGGIISQWQWRTGELLRSIKLPTPYITSLCFAGENLDKIYVTSDSRGFYKNEQENQIDKNEKLQTEKIYAGSLFVILDSGATGVKTNRFGKSNIVQ